MSQTNLVKRTKSFGMATAALSALLVLGACNSTSQVFSHGYQLSEDTLSLIPEGSSKDQVLLSLGTPSSTLTNANGTETYYYISQKKARPVAFARARVIDQRVLAIYLTQDETVERIANYGLKDGRVFDFVRRVTPTGGKDLSFVGQILSAAGSVSPAALTNR